MNLFTLTRIFSSIILSSFPLIAPQMISICSEIKPEQISADLTIKSSFEAPSLILFYSPYCPYSQNVLNYLREIRKTLPMKDVKKNSQNRDELLQLGGKLLVPCLVVNGKAIYNSEEIIEWISDHKDLLDPTR